MRSGFVGLIGRPNVGKSTLVNSIVGKKVAITSNKPQTTRNIIHGIYTDNDSQIVFVDTPGIHKPNHKLGKYLNKQAYYSIDDVDVILMLVDASMGLGKGDRFILEKLKDISKPVILVINKIDKINRLDVLPLIDEYKHLYEFDDIVPLSALKNDNTKELVKVIKNYLKDEFKLAESLKNEYCIKVSGKLVARSEDMINPKIPTGEVELMVENLEILSEAEPVPFNIYEDKEINESIGLKYRYLDLRRSNLQNNIKVRHQITSTVREYLNNNDFLEIETPILCKSI